MCIYMHITSDWTASMCVVRHLSRKRYFRRNDSVEMPTADRGQFRGDVIVSAAPEQSRTGDFGLFHFTTEDEVCVTAPHTALVYSLAGTRVIGFRQARNQRTRATFFPKFSTFFSSLSHFQSCNNDGGHEWILLFHRGCANSFSFDDVKRHEMTMVKISCIRFFEKIYPLKTQMMRNLIISK